MVTRHFLKKVQIVRKKTFVRALRKALKDSLKPCVNGKFVRKKDFWKFCWMSEQSPKLWPNTFCPLVIKMWHWFWYTYLFLPQILQIVIRFEFSWNLSIFWFLNTYVSCRHLKGQKMFEHNADTNETISKNGPSKICRRESILEYFDLDVTDGEWHFDE